MLALISVMACALVLSPHHAIPATRCPSVLMAGMSWSSVPQSSRDLLQEWGCTSSLWSKVRSKQVLIDLAVAGDEAAGRERIEMLQKSPSISGINETPLPPEIAALGVDEKLWFLIRSKKPLLDLVASGDEDGARARIASVREKVAAEAAAAAATKQRRKDKKERKRGGDVGSSPPRYSGPPANETDEERRARLS